MTFGSASKRWTASKRVHRFLNGTNHDVIIYGRYLEKEPRTIENLEIQIRRNGEWRKVDHIRPFKPLPIQHRDDEGWPETYVCEDGVEVPTRAPFVRERERE